MIRVVRPIGKSEPLALMNTEVQMLDDDDDDDDGLQ